MRVKKKMKQIEDADMKKSIRAMIVIGICVIAVIVAALVFWDLQYCFMEDAAIFLTLSLSMCSILVATLGIYITYRIQNTIASINARNRENDSFYNKLQFYMQKVEAINQTYQSLVGTTDPTAKKAYANTLSTQAVLAYYALKDIENSSLYRNKFTNNKELSDISEEQYKVLTQLSDVALFAKDGMERALKGIDVTIGPINDNCAQYRLEIHKVLYPTQETMEDRIV